MTTLRREIIQIIKNKIDKYLSTSQDFLGETIPVTIVEDVADAVLELRAFNKESLKSDLAKKSLEAAIVMGGELPIPDGEHEREIEALETFERDMKFNPLPWGSTNAWEKLEKFVVSEMNKDSFIFFKYKSWQEGDGMFDAMKNKQIYDNPLKFIATFPEFKKTLAKKSVSEPKVDDNGIPISY